MTKSLPMPTPARKKALIRVVLKANPLIATVNPMEGLNQQAKAQLVATLDLLDPGHPMEMTKKIRIPMSQRRNQAQMLVVMKKTLKTKINKKRMILMSLLIGLIQPKKELIPLEAHHQWLGKQEMVNDTFHSILFDYSVKKVEIKGSYLIEKRFICNIFGQIKEI